MPTPTPTDEDINFVREVTGENSYTLIESLIDTLTDATWDRALVLVGLWNLVTAGDLIALSGGREGVQLSDQEGLDDIRARMRLLLGLPEFRDASILGGPGSRTVLTVWRW